MSSSPSTGASTTAWARPMLAASLLGLALGSSAQIGMDGNIERRLSSLLDDNEINQEPSADDEYKSGEDWWKDPLAAFDNEEEEEEDVDDLFGMEGFDDEEEEASVELDDDSEELFDMEDAGDEEAEPLELEEDEEAEPLRTQEEEEPQPEEPSSVAENKDEIKLTRRERRKAARDSNTDSQAGSKPHESSFSLPPATSILPMIPKVRTALSSIPSFQIIAGALLVKNLVMDKTRGSDKKRKPKQKQQAFEEEDSRYDDLESDVVSDEIEEEILEPQRKTKQEISISTPKRPAPPKKVQIGSSSGFLERMVNMVPKGGNRQKIPSAKNLLEERDSLRQRVDVAETERDNMEREYEKTSWELQEVQTDLRAQASTTRYLKAQLRDSEQMLERAVRAERDRAREELKRMKEAMLRVLERERQAMRAEVKRQTTELQTLLDEANGMEPKAAVTKGG